MVTNPRFDFGQTQLYASGHFLSGKSYFTRATLRTGAIRRVREPHCQDTMTRAARSSCNPEKRWKVQRRLSLPSGNIGVMRFANFTMIAPSVTRSVLAEITFSM
jgi:hypothetical protein